MKSLTEYINEALNQSFLDWKNVGKSKFSKISGKLRWTLKSKEYGVDEDINCDDWYVGTNNEQIIFWSPKSTWMPYVFVSEIDSNKLNWALVGMDQSLTDPSAVCSKILDKFLDYAGEVATVPEMDKISVPNEAERIITMAKSFLKIGKQL